MSKEDGTYYVVRSIIMPWDSVEWRELGRPLIPGYRCGNVGFCPVYDTFEAARADFKDAQIEAVAGAEQLPPGTPIPTAFMDVFEEETE